MIRGFKKIISALLCSTLMITTVGCSSDGKSKSMGRYLEEVYEMPQSGYVQNMVQLQDGKIAMIGYNDVGELSKLLSEDDGKNWTSTPIELPKVEGKETYPGEVSILKNGDIIISYFISDPMPEGPIADDGIIEKEEYKEPEIKYLYLDSEGNKKDTEIKIAQEETDENMGWGMPIRFKSTDSGDILYQSGQGDVIVQVDGTTWEEKHRYENIEYVENFLIAGDSMILWQYSGIVEYDLTTGEEKGNLEKLEKETVKAQTSYYPTVIDSGSKDKLYYYSVLGLYSYDLKTEEIKMLIDGSLSYFGNREIYLRGFIEKENGDFLTLFDDWNAGGSTLINYYYSADTPSVPDKQLVVYSLLENDTIRQAVAQFSKTNKDTYVKYEAGLTWGDGVTEADALKKLNTEIMSGKGPDIILLDNLPIDSYIEKGLLEDISDIVNGYVNEGKLFKNMADAYTVDGKIYQFPTAFKLPMLIGDKSKIDKVTDLKSMTDLVKEFASENDKRIFNDMYSPRGTVYSLYYLYGNDWLNDDNTINEDTLTNYMTSAKEIYDINKEKFDKYMEEMDAIYKDKVDVDGDMSVGTSDNLSIEDDKVVDPGFEQPDISEDVNNLYEMSYSLAPYAYVDGFLMDDKPANLVYGGIQDGHGYGTLITVLNSNLNIDYKVLTRGEENLFIPIECIGVNAKSENKEIAKEFVKQVLSDETQSTGWRQGFPVNKNAFEKQFKLEKNENFEPEFDEATNHYIMGSFGTILPDGTEKMIKQLWPNDDDVARLISEVEKVNVAPKINRVLLIEVAKQFESYVNGTCTIEEAVKTIVDNLDLYLSE